MDEDWLYEPEPKNNKRRIAAIVSVIVVIALAVLTASLLAEFVLGTFIVNGHSMDMTLDGGTSPGDPGYSEYDGETLILNKTAKIKRGDIVVFKYDWGAPVGDSTRSLVKRAIGLPGDFLQIVDNVLYVNGEAKTEVYINGPMHFREDYIWGSNLGRDIYIDGFTVPADHIFCMGDNRNNSKDSRMIGAVPMEKVAGKCVAILDNKGGIRFPKR